MSQFAIIGFGCAGYHALAAIREAGCDVPVDIYTETAMPPYNPMLTTYYVAGKLPYEGMFPFGSLEDIRARYDANVITGARVASVDAAGHLVCLADGSRRQYDKILVATGNTFYSMLGQMAGAITNIILDPIMIFGMFGLPAMGAAGAAIATVLGQCVGFGLDLWFNLRFNKEVELSFKGFRPHGTTIRRIYSVGVPCIGMQSIGSVMVLGMNSILMNFSSTAVAFFGVYFKLQSFVFMPVFGMNNGMVPILGYNYGARKPKRMLATIKLATAYATGIMLVGVVIVQLFAAQLLGIFDASDALLAIGVPGLRIICLSFIFAGISVVGSSVFQALGHGFLSLWVSVIRQLVVLLPVAWAIAHFTDRLELVWLAFPIAELVAVTLSSLFLTKVYRQVIKPMMNNA